MRPPPLSLRPDLVSRNGSELVVDVSLVAVEV